MKDKKLIKTLTLVLALLCDLTTGGLNPLDTCATFEHSDYMLIEGNPPIVELQERLTLEHTIVIEYSDRYATVSTDSIFIENNIESTTEDMPTEDSEYSIAKAAEAFKSKREVNMGQLQEVTAPTYRTYSDFDIYNISEDVSIDFSSVQTMSLDLTYYCICQKCCGQYSWEHSSNLNNPNFRQTTASGTKATEGRTIATDPSVIPLGSIVHIDGVNFVAEDTGGAIKGNRADVFVTDHERCIELGRAVEVEAVVFRK